MTMVSTACPSTSFQAQCAAGDLGISGTVMKELMGVEEVIILDCRARGTNLKTATRVRLPHVLFRRLQNGSLPLGNISARLADESLPVVVIPEEEETPTAQSKHLIKALTRDNSRRVFVLSDDVEDVVRRFPLLSDETATWASCPPTRRPDDSAGLNLNSLRIEGGITSGTATLDLTPMPKTNDKRQVFPVQILPHLYLGNAETAQNRELLHSHGIHHIVNVTSNLPNAFEGDPDFHYLRISVDDNASFNLTQFFPEAIAFIKSAEKAGDACLVHCLAGISRSVTICLAYLMSANNWSLEEAYDMVLGRNASIAPNFHFMGQLTDYERHLGITSRKPSVPRSPTCASQAALPPSACLTPPPTSFASNNNRGFQD